MSINVKTYLTPSIPKEIFEILSEYIENKCNIKVNLLIETTSSGPKKGERAKNQDMPIKYIRCDKAGENQNLHEYIVKQYMKGVAVEFSTPGTPQQNGVVERAFAFCTIIHMQV